MSGAIKTLAPYVKVITTDATRLRRRTATDSTVVEDIFIAVDLAVVGKRCSAWFSLLRFRRVTECPHSPGDIAGMMMGSLADENNGSLQWRESMADDMWP